MEQAISCLKLAIKAYISRPEIQRRMDDRDEARVRGIVLNDTSWKDHILILLYTLILLYILYTHTFICFHTHAFGGCRI